MAATSAVVDDDARLLRVAVPVPTTRRRAFGLLDERGVEG